MIVPAEFPEEVRTLLRERIDSHEELEALVLLAHDRGVLWSPARLTGSLRPPPADPAAVLARLAARGFATPVAPIPGASPASGAEPGYRYAPASGAIDQAVLRLLELHRTDLPTLLRLLNAHAMERVRSGAMRAFADAFLLRRDPNDG